MAAVVLQLQLLAWLFAGSAMALSGSDVAALVQRDVIAHQMGRRGGVVQEAFKGALGTLVHSVFQAGKPPKGSKFNKEADKGGIHVSRKIRTIEKGSKAAFYLEPGCEVRDEHGTDNCTLRWGDDAELRWGLILPSGLRVGDVINISATVTVAMPHVQNEVLKTLLTVKNKTVSLDMSCSLCTGSCVQHTKEKATGYVWNLTSPTFMDDRAMCRKIARGENVTDFELANVNFKLPPGPPASLDLHGELAFSVSLARRGAGELLYQSVRLRLLPTKGGAKAELLALPAPGPALAEEEAAEPSRGILGMLVALSAKSWNQTLERLSSSKDPYVELWQKKSSVRGKKLQNLFVRIKGAEFEGSEDYRANASMTGAACGSGKYGENECVFPFNSKSKASFNWNTDVVLEPGSYMTVRIGPKLQGPFGKLFNIKMSSEFKVPACSDSGEAVDVHVMKQKMQLNPGRCGRWSNQVSVPDFEVDVPDFANMKLKEFIPQDANLPMSFPLPDSVVNMPPFALFTETHIYHKDDSPIMSFAYEVGMDNR